jgi:hypothetical protein
MTTWQSPSSRPLSIHNLVLGVAIGLAILCAAITLVVVLERRRSDEPGLGSVIASFDVARGELQRSTEAMREATTALQAATRAPTTINIMDLPPPPAHMNQDLAAPTRYCPEQDRCVVPRAVIEAMLANPASLVEQARLMPSVQDGVARGYKIYGIRPGSLPRELGLKNGDLLQRINGLPLTSMDESMAAYAKLRRSDTLVLELERKGAPLTKEISIQ